MTKTLCWQELSLGWFPFKLVRLLYFPVPGVSTWVFKFGTPGRLPMWVCAQKFFCPKRGVKILKLLWPDRVLCTVLKCFCCSQSVHVRSCYVRIWSIFPHFFLQRFFPPRAFALSDWSFPTLCCPIAPKTFPSCMGCDGASFETFWHDFWRSGVVGGTPFPKLRKCPLKIPKLVKFGTESSKSARILSNQKVRRPSMCSWFWIRWKKCDCMFRSQKVAKFSCF